MKPRKEVTCSGQRGKSLIEVNSFFTPERKFYKSFIMKKMIVDAFH